MALARAAPLQLIPEAHASLVWRTLHGIYGPAWLRAYGEYERGNTHVSTWRRALLGLSEEQLRAGLAACAHGAEPAPPTVPLFRNRCLGVPDFPAVLADESRASTPFIRAVYQLANTYDWRMAPVNKKLRILETAYEAVRARVVQGLPPAPASASGNAANTSTSGKADPKKIAPPERVGSHLAEIAGLLHRPVRSPPAAPRSRRAAATAG